MKKVFERMLADERLAGNEDLAPLQKGFLDAKNQVKQAKADKSATKAAYQAAVQRGEKNSLLMMELLTAYRQAKHMLHYQELAAELTKHQLYQWLDNWSRETAVPQSSKEQKAKKKQGGKVSKVAEITEEQETAKTEEKKQKNGPTVSK